MAPIIEPFRILPWDFFASNNAATSPHIEALQISGAPREFELLKRGARVYFRLQDDASRVWATLDDSDDADLVRTFRRALGSGRIGRAFAHQRSGFNYEHGFYFSLLMSARGEVQAREWCATRWFKMEADSPKLREYLASNSKLGVFHPQWKPPFREVLEENWELFYEQIFEEADRQLTQQRWFRGDAATLNRLVAPFIWQRCLPVPPHRMVRFTGRSENASGPPTSAPVPLTTRDDLLPKDLRNLLADQFHIGGIAWREHHWHGVDKRKFWQLERATYFAKVTANPSAHEQLEARLFLRDWMRETLSLAEFEKLKKYLEARP